jgi:hypothetical protein
MKRAAFCLVLAAAFGWTADLRLGKPLAGQDSKTVSEVLARPKDLVGQTLRVKGKVTEVCQMMGCWMALAEPGTDKTLRIKVADGDIMIPKTAVGKMAVAEGKLAKIELSKEQAIARAKHEAEEQGRKFDPAAKIERLTLYQVQGSGIVIQQ